MTRRPWTDSELALLRDTSLSLTEVAGLTGRPLHGVENRAHRFGVRRYREVWVPPPPLSDRTQWTASELALVDDRSLSYAKIAELTGRSRIAVQVMAKRRKAARRPIQSGRADLPWNHRVGDWPEVRLAVLQRDGYSCQDCQGFRPSGRGLVVHHLIPYRLRPVNETAWLLTLCRSCHAQRPEHGWVTIPPHVEQQLFA